MAEAGWDEKPFNERNPFGKGATVITEDNIAHSRNRAQAIRAMKEGKATPEQTALVMETDTVIQEALALRD